MDRGENNGGAVPERSDDNLNLRYQDRAYNERFKRWRRQNKDSFGFYYAGNSRKVTYRQSGGFVNDYPEAGEAKIFRKVISMLGFVLLFRTAADFFFTYIFPFLLMKMGYVVQYSMFSGHYYESVTVNILTDLLAQLVGRALPVIIIISKLRIPASVAFPMKVRNKPMFTFAIPAVLFAAGMCSALSFFHDGLMHFLNIDTARSVMVPYSISSLVYIFATQIIILPVISECCMHGAVLQLLRQFGDGTAILLTSVMIASSPYDITQLLNSMVMAMVIGYFVIRTGSVLTGIIMRVFAKMYFYALSYLDYGIDGFLTVKVFLCGTILLGLIGIVYFFINDGDSFSMKIKRSYMSFDRKMLIIVTNIPIIAWVTFSFLLMLWKLNFRV